MKEKTMKIKKVRMICSTKGCGEKDTFFISLAGDFAGTPNLCKNCLSKAFKLVNDAEKAKSDSTSNKETNKQESKNDEYKPDVNKEVDKKSDSDKKSGDK